MSRQTCSSEQASKPHISGNQKSTLAVAGIGRAIQKSRLMAHQALVHGPRRRKVVDNRAISGVDARQPRLLNGPAGIGDRYGRPGTFRQRTKPSVCSCFQQLPGSPACTGIGPLMSSPPNFPDRFPRLRGDRPQAAVRMNSMYAVPPPARGGGQSMMSKGPKHLDSDFNASSLRFCKPLPCLFRAVWRLDRVTIRPR